jgi:hypothetical protein
MNPSGWWINRPSAAWFVLRLVVLIALTMALPLVMPSSTDAPLRYAPSAAAAAVIVVGFLFWRAEALLAFAIFVLFYETLVRWMGVNIKQIDELAVPGLVLIAGVPALFRWREWFWWPRDLAIALAIVAGLISTFVEGVPFNVWLPALVLVGKGIAFFYVAMWTGVREWELRVGMVVVLAIGVVVMALSFVELLDPIAFQRTLNVQEFYRPRGVLPSLKSLFFHPVMFAWFTTFVALYLYAHFAMTRRWWAFALAFVFSLGPFLAARRRAMLALVAGIAAGALRTGLTDRAWRTTARRWLPTGIAVVVLFIMFLPGIANLYRLTAERYLPPASTPAPGEVPLPGEEFPGIEGERNPQVRIVLYETSVRVAADHYPLGAGFGRYASWMSRVHYSPVYAEYGLTDQQGLRPQNPVNVTDTFWPQILGELGVIGFVAYAGFMGSLGWIAWKLAGDTEASTTLRVFRLGTGMVLVQAFVESLASPMFHSPPRAYLLYLVVGLVAAAWRPRRIE